MRRRAVHDDHPVVELTGQIGDHRIQIDAFIGDMHGDQAVGLHVPRVEGERLPGQQVNRNGIAVEGIEDQHVKILRRFPLQ